MPNKPTLDQRMTAYKVGPGRPPREFQFKPGQSGNPKGAKRKPASIVPDLKGLLERALHKKAKLTKGEQTKIVTMAEAGIEQLVAQFAKGDRHARRDVMWLADKLGIDLIGKSVKAIENAFGANPQALLDAYVARRTDATLSAEKRVFAPAQLLDDDPEP